MSISTNYPEKSTSMADLIDRLYAAPDRLDAALAGLTVDEVEAHPVAGKWSIREAAAHIAQVSVGWTNIMFEAMDGFYPTPRSENVHWMDALIEETLTGLEAARSVFHRQNASVAQFLASLPASDYDRPFKIVSFLTEPFLVKESVNWGLVIHCDWHLGAIHRLRALLSKPLGWMAVYLERYPNADPAKPKG